MKDKYLVDLIDALKHMVFWQSEVTKQILSIVEDETRRRIDERNNKEHIEFC